MDFNYRLLNWWCTECRTPGVGTKLGITSDFRIIALWHCSVCDKDITAFFTLEDLLRAAPASPNIHPARLNKEDMQFFKDLHISLEN